MRTKKIITATLSIFLLTGQEGLPLRPHGRFTAQATGAMTGNIMGDVSAELHRDGTLSLEGRDLTFAGTFEKTPLVATLD